MTWEELFKIITLIIGSFGGEAAIMLAIIKWSSNIMATKIKADIEQKYKKDMASYEKQLSDSTAKLNSLLQNNSYMIQYQYKLEMEIYREVWKALFDLMICKEWINDLKVLNLKSSNISGESDFIEQKKEHCSMMMQKLGAYQKIIDINAPFYKKELYEVMKEIAIDFQKIGEIFLKYQDEIRLAEQDDSKQLEEACKNIDKRKDFLVEKLRSYLQSLKCIL